MDGLNEIMEDHIFALVKTRNPHGYILVSDLVGISWGTLGGTYPKQFHYYHIHTDNLGNPENMNQLSMGVHTVTHPDKYHKLDISKVLKQLFKSSNSFPIAIMYLRYEDLQSSAKDLIRKFNSHSGLRPVWMMPELNKSLAIKDFPKVPEVDSNGILKF